MAQTTMTSPTWSKVTGVDAPGACAPRLDSASEVSDMALCGTVSSLTKVRASPFFTVTSVTEKARPFWWTIASSARAATEAAEIRVRAAARRVLRIYVSPELSRLSARQWGERRRIDGAGERLEEGHQLRLLFRAEAKRLDQVGAAGTGGPARVRMVD